VSCAPKQSSSSGAKTWTCVWRSTCPTAEWILHRQNQKARGTAAIGVARQRKDSDLSAKVVRGPTVSGIECQRCIRALPLLRAQVRYRRSKEE